MSYFLATLLSILSCVLSTALMAYMSHNFERILRPRTEHDFGDGLRLIDVFWFYTLALASMGIFFMAVLQNVWVAFIVALVYHVLTCRLSPYLRSVTGHFCLRGHENINKWGFPNRRFFRRSHF